MDPSIGLEIRKSRLFNKKSDKTFVVALDHGILMGPIQGIENIADTVSKVVRGGADAIQVTPPVVQAIKENFFGRGSPALIARLDHSNYWRATPAPKPGYYTKIFTVKDAVRANADAVVTYLLTGFEDDRQEEENLRSLADMVREAQDYGMPIIIEPLGLEKGSQAVRNESIIKLAVRMATEIGADFLKVDYTGEKSSFKAIVGSTFAPILVRGGPKTKTMQESFQMVKDSLDCGARGIVFGRNVWQAPDITNMTKTLAGLVHGELNVRQATKMVK
jgi:class I fructose-bisphosphate aldolase